MRFSKYIMNVYYIFEKNLIIVDELFKFEKFFVYKSQQNIFFMTTFQTKNNDKFSKKNVETSNIDLIFQNIFFHNKHSYQSTTKIIMNDNTTLNEFFFENNSIFFEQMTNILQKKNQKMNKKKRKIQTKMN